MRRQRRRREIGSPRRSTADTLAYLQYTSGSTATPKGVMVTHSNLLHNLFDLDAGWEHTPESVLVTWLPTFHDMGLVYGILEPLYRGFRCFVMPPLAFLQHPARWLRAISDRQATHSVGPNFAYELCVRKVKPEERVGLDLSGWMAAINGAEPVRRETLERFHDMFAPCGFRWKAFCPGFGLAEATLKVTATRSADDPVFCSVEADSLENHRIKECPPIPARRSHLRGLRPGRGEALAWRSLTLKPSLRALRTRSARFGFRVPASRAAIGRVRRKPPRPSARD